MPDGYAQSRLFKNLHFDPRAGVCEAEAGAIGLTVIGSCVRTDADIDPESSAEWLAEALAGSETRMFERLADLCGRFVVVYRKGLRISVVGDAACARSIAYVKGEGIVASHAQLAQDNRRRRRPRVRFPEVRGYPGDGTPWPKTFLLTPNMVMDAETGALRRFYPLDAAAPLSAEEAADIVSRRAITAFRNFGTYRRPIVLGLTAGLDSRCVLGVARRSGVPFCVATYLADQKNVVDCEIAGQIARRLGVEHHLIDLRGTDGSEVASLLRQNSYHMSSAALVAELLDRKRPWEVFVSGNLLEIGRAFYRQETAVDTPAAAASVFMSSVASKRPNLDDAELEALKQRSENQFAAFFERTDFARAAQRRDSRDLLYWEHRMPAWHSQTILNRDLALDTFIPFNARSIFNALLSVGYGDRLTGAAFRRIIATLLPELADVPVNPRPGGDRGLSLTAR